MPMYNYKIVYIVSDCRHQLSILELRSSSNSSASLFSLVFERREVQLLQIRVKDKLMKYFK